MLFYDAVHIPFGNRPMRLRIFHKTFIALMLVTTCALMVLAAVTHWNLSRGFLSYIVDAEARRLEPLKSALADEYADNGDWKNLAGDSRAWMGLMARSQGRLNEQESHLELPPPPPPDAPPHLMQPVDPPPPMRTQDEPPTRTQDDSPGSEHRQRREHRRPWRTDPFFASLQSRLSLLDSNKQLVVGSKPKHRGLLQEITVDDKIVGYLSLQPRREFSEALEMRFLHSQLVGLAQVAGLMLLLAALVAWLLARHLTRPVLSLAEITKSLNAGKFAVRSNVKSADEVGDLASGINTLAHSLERNEQARRDWLADIAHELRTPLTAMRGEIEAAQDGVRLLGADTLDALHGDTMALIKLVDDLNTLALSDIGALSYQFAATPLQEISDRVVQSFAARWKAAGLNMDYQAASFANIVINADADRLYQLLANLAQNSLRYTDTPGQIALFAKVDANNVSIHWQDSAPGVADDALVHLFERFYRVDSSRSRNTGGSGLGLAICRSIVDAHGGSICANHSALGGLEICIRLPCLIGVKP